jgi:hypothetical protein
MQEYSKAVWERWVFWKQVTSIQKSSNNKSNFFLVLPDVERMKILEKKVIDELGEEACARLPPNLRIVEPPQPTSDGISASSRSSSDDENSLDGMDDENDENQNDNNQPGTSTDALKEEPQFDGRVSQFFHQLITHPSFFSLQIPFSPILTLQQAQAVYSILLFTCRTHHQPVSRMAYL